MPLSLDLLREEVERFLAVENPGDGIIYLQLTRGVAARNHLFPKGGAGDAFVLHAVYGGCAAAGTGGGCEVKDD